MISYPIPDGPHNVSWKALLPDAFAVIDEATRRHGDDFPVQIGGGSMLARRYGHRESRNLDLFVSDVRLVRWCSPRLNDAADDLFADYAEDAASLKLVTGMQEVDVIAAAPLLDDGVEEDVLAGRPVLIERPREILAKKLFYQGRRMEPRDVFDIAAVAEAEPEEVEAAFGILSPAQLDGITRRLQDLEPVFDRQIGAKVHAWPAFEHVKQTCLQTVRDLVDQWRERHHSSTRLAASPGTAKTRGSGQASTVLAADPGLSKARPGLALARDLPEVRLRRQKGPAEAVDARISRSR